MRILIATGLYPPEIGGPATYSKLLFHELPKYGFEVEVVPFSSVRWLPVGIRHLVYFFKVHTRAQRADLIYAQDAVSVGLPAMLAARVLKKRFWLRVPGDYAWEQGVQRFGVTDTLDIFFFFFGSHPFPVRVLAFIQSWVACRAERVIAQCEYLKNIIQHWGVPESRISVVYNGFHKLGDVGNRATLRGVLRFRGKLIVSAGRLVSWKGFQALIEIMPRLLKDIPKARLMIVGDGPQMKKLEALTEKLKLQNHVVFTGKLERAILLRYLRAADVFVLNTKYEGISNQILEALAVGVPVVSTKAGGNPEVITNQENGLLISPDDKRGLKRAIEAVLTDRRLSEKLSRRGKSTIKKFNAEQTVKDLVSILS